jgi:hypothetical protein
MSRVASGVSSLLAILYAPVIYAIILQAVYHTDPISVLLEGPTGWVKYTIATFISLVVTAIAVGATMRGGGHAIGL